MTANNDNFRSTFAQVLATVMYSLSTFGVGMMIILPTILIGALRTDRSTGLHLSEEQASWFGSLYFIVQPLASILAGMVQTGGRRTCVMLVNIPMLVAWIIFYHATSVTHLFIAQGIMGVSAAFMEPPLASCVGEITQPRLRGVLSSMGPLFSNTGFVVESLLGAFLPWREMIFYSAFAPVVAFLVMIVVPESPTWLVTKGRHEEARRSYQWLRGWVGPQEVQEELNALVNYVKQSNTDNHQYTAVATDEGGVAKAPAPAPRSSWRTLLEPEVLIALRIIMISSTVIGCVTLIGIRTFFIEVLDDMKLPYDSNVILTVLLGLQMIGVFSVGLGFKLLGRRPLIFLCLSVNIVCCLGLGVCFSMPEVWTWLPIIFFAGSYIFGAIIMVRFVLITELFPLRARVLGGGICIAWAYTSLFLVVKTYYFLSSALGVSGVCFLYGVIGVLGLAYLYWDLPETEGVSLENIEKKMAERSQKPDPKGPANKEETTVTV